MTGRDYGTAHQTTDVRGVAGLSETVPVGTGTSFSQASPKEIETRLTAIHARARANVPAHVSYARTLYDGEWEDSRV